MRRLAGHRVGIVLGTVEALLLKGFAEPVLACEVEWIERESHVIPVPETLSVDGHRIFVGRDAERARLETAYVQSVAGEPMLVLVGGGEPGVGKTRLLAEFARPSSASRACPLRAMR